MSMKASWPRLGRAVELEEAPVPVERFVDVAYLERHVVDADESRHRSIRHRSARAIGRVGFGLIVGWLWMSIGSVFAFGGSESRDLVVAALANYDGAR